MIAILSSNHAFQVDYRTSEDRDRISEFSGQFSRSVSTGSSSGGSANVTKLVLPLIPRPEDSSAAYGTMLRAGIPRQTILDIEAETLRRHPSWAYV